MTSSDDDLPPSDYEIGYGKPPRATRFKKGKSGNPGGRLRGMTVARANALVLKEAYRSITVREGDKVSSMPAMQVVLRSQFARAAKGNGPAQRAVVEAVQAIERDRSAQAAAKESAQADVPKMTHLEAARRVAFLLERGRRELERQATEVSGSDHE